MVTRRLVDHHRENKQWRRDSPPARTDYREIESSAKFRSDREATSVARTALRSMAYENQDSGWSKFRCHARLPGQPKAFCGARIANSPNTQHAYSEPCGKCEKILESIPDPDEAENDIKKYFRYVSFNSERNPDVNSKGE